MSAIANISAALGYDDVEIALVTGSLADALKLAASKSVVAVDADLAPSSARDLTVAVWQTSETVRPSR